MSPEGFVLMAEMIANQAINIDVILEEVRRGMACVCQRCGRIHANAQAARACRCEWLWRLAEET